MSERGDDLRATAELLVEDADRLKAIEEAKLALPEDDERVLSLSQEAVRVAESMATAARIELAIAKEPAG
jgi:hypothetical protein